MRSVRTSGFTLIEALIALSLVAIVLVKVTLVLNSANEATVRESASLGLEEQANRVLDQITFAIMGCDRASLMPDPQAPIWDTGIRYRYSFGIDDEGGIIWSDTEEVSLNEERGQVQWITNPGELEERRVAWCNVVRPFLEGEIPNGEDDNANGLVDESGLTFTMDRDAVVVRLTLERQRSGGDAYTQSVQTTVTIRN